MAPNYSVYKSFYEIPPDQIDKKRRPIITNKFSLAESTKNELQSMEPEFGFGQFGKIIYYRTYSRKIFELTKLGIRRRESLKHNKKSFLRDLLTEAIDNYGEDNEKLQQEITHAHKLYSEHLMTFLREGKDYIERQEHWADTVIRCIEGCFSYRKNHMVKNGLHWNDDEWQDFAREMAISLFNMEWLCPGRGLWASGTDYTYERGGACLNNCAYTNLNNLPQDIVWVADMLMSGCGVGATLSFNGNVIRPNKNENFVYVIPDNREGWSESVGLLIKAYVPDKDGKVGKFPTFDYSAIRNRGTPLKGFGGEASGPSPLIKYHKRVEIYLDTFLNYNEAITKEEQLECFITMVRDLRPYDNEYMSDEMFNDLERHLRGQPVIKCPKDLLKYIRYNCFEHLTNDEYDHLSKCLGIYSISSQLIRLIQDIKIEEDTIAKICQDKYGKYYKDLFLYILDCKKNSVVPDEEILASHFGKATNDLNTDVYLSADKRVYNMTRLCADIMNATGACVVAGNIRRSSEILGFAPTDQIGLDLKDSIINPERESISWMSNNSAIFSKTEDFKHLPEITKRVVEKGEPGFFNLLNVKRFGRIGRRLPKEGEWTREYEEDLAEFVNPCGEIPLCNKELCNLVELIPVRCRKNDGSFDEQKFYNSIKYATFYASSVSLIPTHWSSTNEIIAQNRRIGVSITGGADLYEEVGFTELTRLLRTGYRIVREENRRLARTAGVPESIRTTTVKPSGTISLIAGVSAGLHFPIFQYANRRVRMASDSELGKILKEANYPCEKDVCSDNTDVFSFPLNQGKTRKASDVSLWEKFRVLETFQREWADNAVSNTLEFNPKTEGHLIESMLAQSAPVIKTCSLLPHVEKGAYAQMPYEGITKKDYRNMMNLVKDVDWSRYGVKNLTDGMCPKFCTNDTCEY